MIPTRPIRTPSRWRLAGGPLAWAAAFLLAGCNLLPPPTSDPTRYFVLTGPALAAGSSDAGIGSLRLGLKAVQVPEYLRGRAMVLRDGANELVLQDYARWAEPLQQGLTRVLKAELLADHSVGRVDTAPLPFEADRDYDVGIDIVLCEGAAEGARHVARFEAVIEISTVGPQAHVVARRDFVAPEAGWNGTDYGRLAGELSQDAAALGREILSALPAK
jgi:uncharacterized lipoprotein YmbA